jgi:hypothetical protein
MVHHHAAEHHVERVVRKGELLDQADLEIDGKAALGRFVTSNGDHLRGRVNAMYLTSLANLRFGEQRDRSGATSNIKHRLSWLQLGQIHGHLPHGLLSS